MSVFLSFELVKYSEENNAGHSVPVPKHPQAHSGKTVIACNKSTTMISKLTYIARTEVEAAPIGSGKHTRLKALVAWEKHAYPRQL